METYKSNYLTITYDSLLMELDWTEKTFDMSSDDYKSEMLEYVKALKEYRPEQVLINAQKAGYIISPELQEWANENVIKVAISCGLKRTAILVSKDYISQLSIEQTFDEDTQQVVKRRFFDDRNAAIAWLQSND